ncbi:MAG: hypothetical protein KBI47_08840 [Armatimonadetes bacterium]|nr:hypothetical protein [Armatimonadota bacterium]
MASAIANRLDDWEQWLMGNQKDLSLPWAVVAFTDQVCVTKTDAVPAEWLKKLCDEHETGGLLEARLFGDDAEILIRWETSGRWLCRLITDCGEASEGMVALGDPESHEVYLWGQRLGDSQQWFEQRIRPIELPLGDGGALAVADIKVYAREGQDPIWRFSNLHTEGA